MGETLNLENGARIEITTSRKTGLISTITYFNAPDGNEVNAKQFTVKSENHVNVINLIYDTEGRQIGRLIPTNSPSQITTEQLEDFIKSKVNEDKSLTDDQKTEFLTKLQGLIEKKLKPGIKSAAMENMNIEHITEIARSIMEPGSMAADYIAKNNRAAGWIKDT